MKKLKIFLLVFLSNTLVFASSPDLQVTDTIAGLDTIITANNLNADTDYTLLVTKPNLDIINLKTKTNLKGSFSLELDSYHTKQAGTYQVSLKNQNLTKNFKVFPTDLSLTDSQIKFAQETFEINKNIAGKIILKDLYGNLLLGHTLEVFSSSSEDEIIYPLGKNTDKKGVLNFEIKSKKEGVSVLTVFDKTANKTLKVRKKIYFYDSLNKYGQGGNYLTANLLNEQDFSVLDHFEISFPDTVKVNDDSNYLKVVAKDENNKTVKNYTGTITFVVEGDDNAKLPENGEYTFTLKDQGEKEFALALVFSSVGEKIISVYDVEDGKVNLDIFGEKKLTVVKNEQEPQKTDTTNEKIKIKYPTNSSQISQKILNVSGIAPKNTNLKLVLNDEKLSEFSSDSEGFFSTTVNLKQDGQKELYVMSEKPQTLVSEIVYFSLDTTAPILRDLKVSPSNEVFAGEEVKILIESETNLDQVKLFRDGFYEELTEKKEGVYELLLKAPKELGTYNYDVILVDLLGNTANLSNKLSLKVKAKEKIKLNPITDISKQEKTEFVKISWQHKKSENFEKYQIYRGKTAKNLEKYDETLKKEYVFTDLKKFEEYFVLVKVTNEEKDLEEKSEVFKIALTEEKILEPKHKSADYNNNKVEVIAKNSAVNVYWDKVLNADKYCIYLWVNPNYKEKKCVKETSQIISDLQNNIKYNLTVKAFTNKEEISSARFNTVKFSPDGEKAPLVPSQKKLYDFSQTKEIKGQTGLSTYFLVLSAFFLGTSYYFIHKKSLKKQSVTYIKTTEEQIKPSKKRINF